MKCERCGAEKSVSRYDVDGFSGQLCDDCVDVWEAIEADQTG
jgi:hypothetical protein